MALVISEDGQNGACDGYVDLLNGGNVKIKTSGDTVLATVTLGSPAFGNAGASVAGRADANAMTPGTAVATGTAAKATVHKSDETLMGTMTVSTSGADINLNNTSIASGQEVGLDNFYITCPTGA